MKVFVNPTTDSSEGGIRRVIEAMARYLPDFGIQVVADPKQADLINNHGTMLTEEPGVPMVSSCHGLYWDGYDWPNWGHDANRRVIESMRRAQAVTVPSHWVKNAVSRGMLVNPTVIHHGVDAAEWEHGEENLGYVLWNKARIDPVSDPADMNRVAALLPRVPFLSTFGEPTKNVGIVGPMDHVKMKKMIQRAGIYLATTRETFGIGTLEAMAAGVPIVGWNYGGQSEIIGSGTHGYLVEVGDYEALAYRIELALRERKRLSANVSVAARELWSWERSIEHYATIFREVMDKQNKLRQSPKVSVIITCHNLGRFLGDALNSVSKQTLHDWEVIVVDDASSDNTSQVFDEWAVENLPEYAHATYQPTPHNLGLSGARNFGFSKASGRYVIFLDADDEFSPNALETLGTALDNDTSIHIAAGGLDVMNHEGGDRRRNPWPLGEFNWGHQMTHLNQLTYASMMRREVMERSGGYRNRDWRAEDAAFWCRVTSLGFRAAQVTGDSTLIYRIREDSKTKKEHELHTDLDGDWTAWFPWRTGAGSGVKGVELKKAKIKPNPRLVPWSAQGEPPPDLRFWPVRHHQDPLVSVIIPVGPGHQEYLVDALDSLVAQTFPNWEVIVVNDTGNYFELPTYPYARILHLYASTGAGGSRNVGIEASRGELCLFLDADDILVPNAIELMVRAHLDSRGKYVYCDCAIPEDSKKLDGPRAVLEAADYDQMLWVSSGYEVGNPGRHSVTAMVPKDKLLEVGGFDTSMPFWEDWDLYMKLAAHGVCGVRVPQPLMLYRFDTGNRRRKSKENEESLRKILRDRYLTYATGETAMAPCCGGNATTLQSARDSLMDMMGVSDGSSEIPEVGNAPTTIRLEYVGEHQGAQSYIGPGTGRVYRLGREAISRYADVILDGDKAKVDVHHLVNRLQICKIVSQPAGGQ